MSDKTVDQIYDIHKRLRDAGDNIGAETALFLDLINAAHSTDIAVKTLIATELPKYVHIFPTLAEQALTAQMDLLEDEQTAIRIRAIRGVEMICRHSPQRTRHQGELIGQLLTAEGSELIAVKTTLIALFSIDAKETFAALFTQLVQNEIPLRVNATAFILEQMTRLMAGTILPSEELQKVLGDEIKKVLLSDQVLTPDEIRTWLQHLRQLKAATKETTYGIDITNILIKFAGLDKPFDPNHDGQINAFLTALTLAGGYKEFGLDNEPFLTYFARSIVPVFDTLSAQHKTDLLKSVSLASRFATPKTARALLPGVVDLLNGLIPRAGEKLAAAPEIKEEKDAGLSHKINFSHVECLLFAYHTLATSAPDTVREVSGIFIRTGQPSDFSVDATKRDAFVARLTHAAEQAKAFETQVTEYQKTLNNDKAKNATEEEKKAVVEKRKLAMTAIRTAKAVETLLKPLLGKEPSFSTNIRLSWQSPLKAKGGKKAGAGAGATTTTNQQGQAPKQGQKRKQGGQGQPPAQKQGGQGQAGSKKKQKGQQQQQQQQPAQNKKRKNDGDAGSNKKQRTANNNDAPSYSGQPGETIVVREKPAGGQGRGGGGSASQKRGGGGGRGGQAQGQGQRQQGAGSKKKPQQNGGGGGFSGGRQGQAQRGGGGGGRGRGGRGRGGRGGGRGRR